MIQHAKKSSKSMTKSWRTQCGLLQNPSQKEIAAIHGPLVPYFIQSINRTKLQTAYNSSSQSMIYVIVTTDVEALLATIDKDTLVNFWPCEISK
jgi:hypothetical protein